MQRRSLTQSTTTPLLLLLMLCHSCARVSARRHVAAVPAAPRSSWAEWLYVSHTLLEIVLGALKLRGRYAVRLAQLLPAVGLEATPGDAILFDFRVMHRGMANASGKWRPVLYQTVSRYWFSDDFNFPGASIHGAWSPLPVRRCPRPCSF